MQKFKNWIIKYDRYFKINKLQWSWVNEIKYIAFITVNNELRVVIMWKSYCMTVKTCLTLVAVTETVADPPSRDEF